MYKLFILLFFSFSVSAQNIFPKGVYSFLSELQNKKPSLGIQNEIQIEKKVKSSTGKGDDYKLFSDNPIYSKLIKEEEFLAYSTGDSLFVNRSQCNLLGGYAYVYTSGRYLAFYEVKSQNDVILMGVLFGAIGGAIAGASNNKKTKLHVLDIQTGNTQKLDEKCLLNILKGDLLSKYNAEQDKAQDDILIKYITLLNKDYSY